MLEQEWTKSTITQVPGPDWQSMLLIHTRADLTSVTGFDYFLASFALSQNLDKTKLIVWLDEPVENMPSYMWDLIMKYRFLSWLDFVFFDAKSLMEGSCWEHRTEWSETLEKAADDVKLEGGLWSNLLRMGILWRWGGFWVDARSLFFFDFQPYAERHQNNFVVACTPFNASTAFKDIQCTNEFMMARDAAVRTTIMHLSCNMSVTLSNSTLVRPRRRERPLVPSQIKAGDWFEKYSFKKTKIPQDLWHQDIVLLCQYELIAQTNRQCNFVFYHSKLIDPLFDTGNLHGATDQFCEAASYPPERLLGARIDHFRSVPLGKFLETDDFPLLTRTHVEDCVHAAKPGGLLRILGRRLEIPLGKDLAYVSSVPRNPHN